MRRLCTVALVLTASLILPALSLYAQTGRITFVTRISQSGSLQIVRRPTPLDFSRLPGHGLVTSFPPISPSSQQEPIGTVDLRSDDLSTLDLTSRLSDLLRADFDSHTVWPRLLPRGLSPTRIMELGKDPGLGIRSLHLDGITGAGVGIGIIDQSLLVDHIEYKRQLRLYEEIHWPQMEDSASMHGAAVSSIAVGHNTGVAPGADLYFIANQAGTISPDGRANFDLSSLAQSINRLVSVSETLPYAHRIRVISISLDINPGMNGYDLVHAAIQNASRAGIYTIYVGSDPFSGTQRFPLADPNDYLSFVPQTSWLEQWHGDRGDLLIPTDSRTVASPSGPDDYTFYRFGGASWTVPWVAGLYALACQADPAVAPDIFWAYARGTAHVVQVEEGKQVSSYSIIDPKGLLEALHHGRSVPKQAEPTPRAL